jgi:hypothetical protein
MSISQVAEAKVQPRDVKFRQNARLNNEPYFSLQEFDDTRAVVGFPSKAYPAVSGHTKCGDGCGLVV